MTIHCFNEPVHRVKISAQIHCNNELFNCIYVPFWFSVLDKIFYSLCKRWVYFFYFFVGCPYNRYFSKTLYKVFTKIVQPLLLQIIVYSCLILQMFCKRNQHRSKFGKMSGMNNN